MTKSPVIPFIDFRIESHGSVSLFRPRTAAAEELLQRLADEEIQFFGTAMVVEPRYVGDVINRLQEDGYSVELT